MSALGWVISTPSDRRARSNLRAACWQAKRRQKLREEMAARAGLVSWRDIAGIPIEHPTPRPGEDVPVD